MAENLSFDDLRSVLVPFVLEKVAESLSTCAVVFERWGPLIKRFVHSSDDQMGMLDLMQEFCMKKEENRKVLIPVIKQFYEMDVAEEDTIEIWFKRNEREKNKAICDAARPFVNLLRTADEDDDEDEVEDD
ncbi:hypothetical protein HK096_002026, partial [Nowakowskiella sp. JEL0078]